MGENKKGKIVFSLISFILAAVPLLILLIEFLFCLLISLVAPGGGAIWWLVIATIIALGPLVTVTNTAAVILGIIALIKNKNKTSVIFALSGIIIVFFELAAVLIFFWFV